MLFLFFWKNQAACEAGSFEQALDIFSRLRLSKSIKIAIATAQQTNMISLAEKMSQQAVWKFIIFSLSLSLSLLMEYVHYYHFIFFFSFFFLSATFIDVF